MSWNDAQVTTQRNMYTMHEDRFHDSMKQLQMLTSMLIMTLLKMPFCNESNLLNEDFDRQCTLLYYSKGLVPGVGNGGSLSCWQVLLVREHIIILIILSSSLHLSIN